VTQTVRSVAGSLEPGVVGLEAGRNVGWFAVVGDLPRPGKCRHAGDPLDERRPICGVLGGGQARKIDTGSTPSTKRLRSRISSSPSPERLEDVAT
jgi:hypothetical protein